MNSLYIPNSVQNNFIHELYIHTSFVHLSLSLSLSLRARMCVCVCVCVFI